MRVQGSARLALLAALAFAPACGGGTTSDAGPDAARDDAGALDAGAPPDAGGLPDASVDAGPGVDLGPGGTIGTCAPSPGTCPAGVPQVDVHTVADLMDAARGEGAHAGDAPETCYLVHDGTYAMATNVILLAQVGGTATAPRRFVGTSRDGVRIVGRATIDAPHVVLENMTFDLTGYASASSSSFNTITVLDTMDVTVTHVTMTGDCMTGHQGGAVEVDTASQVIIDCCEIEKFGQCTGDGHLDHGVYLASGSSIVVRNSDIHDNASRGVQLNTEGGAFGTLDTVFIEGNRIHHNGHRDYEDGIVVNGTGTGTITGLTIQNNVIDDNYYSGLRFVGAAQSGIFVGHNTFYRNGAASTATGRSELNLDAAGSGAGTMVMNNIFEVANAELDDCYDAAPRGFVVHDNVVHPSGSSLACVDGNVVVDPMFVDPAGGDFRAAAPAATGYGAYAP